MSVKLSLKAIENIVNSMSEASEIERVYSYATIRVLTSELLEYAKSHNLPHAYISEKIVELLDASRRLASLEPTDSPTETRDLVEALSAIGKLRSGHCFRVDSGEF
jgi:hypothetical protein